jgi:alpha-2-macroglobulin
VLVLEGKAEDGQSHQAMLMQGLPAGWEIAGRIAPPSHEGDKVPGMPWLDTLSATQAQPAADDRFAAILALDTDHPEFRVAVRIRAVTPGSFALPGAELTDMYRPSVFARQAEGRIKILPTE